MFFFASFGVYGRIGALEGFLVILRERCVYFLVTTPSFDYFFLGFLVGGGAAGSGGVHCKGEASSLEGASLSGVWRQENVSRKRNIYVLGHNFKI